MNEGPEPIFGREDSRDRGPGFKGWGAFVPDGVLVGGTVRAERLLQAGLTGPSGAWRAQLRLSIIVIRLPDMRAGTSILLTSLSTSATWRMTS